MGVYGVTVNILTNLEKVHSSEYVCIKDSNITFLSLNLPFSHSIFLTPCWFFTCLLFFVFCISVCPLFSVCLWISLSLSVSLFLCVSYSQLHPLPPFETSGPNSDAHCFGCNKTFVNWLTSMEIYIKHQRNQFKHQNQSVENNSRDFLNCQFPCFASSKNASRLIFSIKSLQNTQFQAGASSLCWRHKWQWITTSSYSF